MAGPEVSAIEDMVMTTNASMMGNVTHPTPSIYILPLEEDPIFGMITLVLLIIMTIGGILGNCLVIISILGFKRMRNSCNILVFNLAIADMSVSIIVNPFAILGVLEGRNYFDPRWMLCNAVATVCLISCICSLFSILAVSINRFVAILHHQYYARMFTIQNTIIIAFGLWMAAAAVEMPNHFGWGGNWFDDKQLICAYDRMRHHSYSLFLGLFVIIMPVNVVCYLYLRIFFFVTRARRAVTSGPGGGDKSADAKVDPAKEERKLKEQKKNVQLARSLFIVFFAFVGCWSPYALAIMFDKYDTWPKLYHGIAVTLAHMSSSGLNSLIYYITQTQFRTAYIQILTCNRYKGDGDRKKIQDAGSTTGTSTTSATMPRVGGN